MFIGVSLNADYHRVVRRIWFRWCVAQSTTEKNHFMSHFPCERTFDLFMCVPQRVGLNLFEIPVYRQSQFYAREKVRGNVKSGWEACHDLLSAGLPKKPHPARRVERGARKGVISIGGLEVGTWDLSLWRPFSSGFGRWTVLLVI